MRYLKFVSKVAGAAIVPFALSAFALSAHAQEPIQVQPPAEGAPPVVVLQPEPEVSSQPPARMDEKSDGMDVGAANEGGAAGDVAPVGAEVPAAPMAPVETVAPAQPSAPAATQSKAASGPETATLAGLVGKPVVDSEGKNVGLVTDVKMTNDGGGVKELHVRTAGFFGFGAKTLVVPANIIAQARSKVQLKLASADLTKLSVVKAPKS